MPFSVIYLISDGLSFFLYTVIKYRREVSLDNLTMAFPNKKKEEIKKILKSSYDNLSDVIMEGLKGLTCEGRDMTKRYKFLNPEVLDNYFDQGKHVITYGSHYGNWEWGPLTIGHQIKHRTLGLVKSIKNPYIQDYIFNKRKAKNVWVSDIANTRAAIDKHMDQPTLFVLISDQSPINIEKAHWVNFLGRDTPFLHGGDTISSMYNWPVVHFKGVRKERGFYQIEIELIEENPREVETGVITERYVRSLERQILENPANWLWTHRRWKRAGKKNA